jgi:alpha-L-fucosidase 2
MQAVNEMLLQSWSARPGSGDSGAIRLFPAAPWRWHNASFDNLRAEGGHRVSARRQDNATTWFKLVPERDGLIRIRDNFGGRVPQWSQDGIKSVNGNYEVQCKAGSAIEATLTPLNEIPPPPARVAVPLEVKRR